MPFSILLCAPRFPSPLGKADSRTVYHMIAFLAGRGHRVHLVTFREPDARIEHAADLRALCASVDVVPLAPRRARLRMARGLFSRLPMQVWYYRQQAMQKAVDAAIVRHQPDLLYGHLIRSAQYLEAYTDHLKVLGLQISYTLNYRRLLEHTHRPHSRLFYRLEYGRVRQYEPALLRRFERALCISPHDKAAFAPDADNLFFNPHGVEVAYYAEALGLPRVPHTIVLNADFEPPTNIDAALYFYRDIFPRVRAAVPEARLWLAGRKPPPVLLRLREDPAVTVTGFVPDIRPWLQRATVAIDPLRIGAGMQNKVLVAMAAGTPVVATTMANEGIAAEDGRAIVLADTADAFADAVIGLLRDPEACARLAANARHFVETYWTWEYHFAQLERMLLQLLDEGPDAEIEQYMPLGAAS